VALEKAKTEKEAHVKITQSNEVNYFTDPLLATA
jgi:hypothetical protein